MFGLRVTTQRELALLNATIKDQRSEIESLRKLIDHERRRAEGAINLLLLRTQKAVIDPAPPPLSLDQEDKLKEAVQNIFGDEYEEGNFIEDLQNVSTPAVTKGS